MRRILDTGKQERVIEDRLLLGLGRESHDGVIVDRDARGVEIMEDFGFLFQAEMPDSFVCDLLIHPLGGRFQSDSAESCAGF